MGADAPNFWVDIDIFVEKAEEIIYSVFVELCKNNKTISWSREPLKLFATPLYCECRPIWDFKNFNPHLFLQLLYIINIIIICKDVPLLSLTL